MSEPLYPYWVTALLAMADRGIAVATVSATAQRRVGQLILVHREGFRLVERHAHHQPVLRLL